MIQISQDSVSRKWGFRILEGDSADSMGISRQLYEDFSYDSPNTVYAVLADIQKALAASRIKNTRDGIIYGYTLWGMNNSVVMSEGGWTSQDTIDKHVNAIKNNVATIRMMMLPKPKVINIGGGGSSTNSALTSTYTDPATGETKTFGNNQSSQELLNRARQMERQESTPVEGWE